jgi:ferredoxin-nitrate reductase
MSGLSHSLLRQRRSVQWPCPNPDHPGTDRLFADGRFPTADGRCRLWAEEPCARSEVPDARFPLVLTTGRIRDQWHTQTRSGLVNKLNRTEPAPFCELHPADAAPRDISDGDLVEVASARGTCRVRARLTPGIRSGVCFLPMHWGPLLGGAEGRANAVVSERLDPVSKEPDLKYSAVEVRRFVPAARRIVVVGAGAAALAFCRAHRTACPQDRITVIGEESEAGYDRVQLPHLIAGERTWGQLCRVFPEEVTVITGVRVERIDRDTCTVLGADGSRHAYDHLVLATGSRPAMTVRGPGVLGLRNRADANAILGAQASACSAVIIGAGLLGLELAAALRQRGMQVTVLQRSERIMGRQLDATAAGHLTAMLRERGIEVRLNTQVVAVKPGAVILNDGTLLSADRIVVATGTDANDQLASAAGLACDRGIQVDARLTTADPHISAIGECATVQAEACAPRVRVGTTPGATAQADVLARVLAGDPAARWRPVPLPNLLKVHGLQLAAVGEVEERDGDDVVTLHDQRRRRYVKAVIRADRVVGAICLGDLGAWPNLLDLCQSGSELDDLRERLLAPGGGAVEGRLVCSCLQVGETTILRAAQDHAGDVAKVCAATRAGSGCGSCRPEVMRLCAAAATNTLTAAPTG